MKYLRFIIPIILLIKSCVVIKVNAAVNNFHNSFIDTVNNDSINILQKQIDSIYIKNLKYIEENPYSDNFDTKLKGGFSIAYYHDKELQHLLYKKGDIVIDTINSCSLGLLYKNLGYIGADFDKSFVFVNSFGSGNPHYISLYNKENMKNLIPSGSAWIDVDTTKQVLLYSKSDVPIENNGDKMTLFDTRKMTEKDYPFPKEIFGEPFILYRIRLVNVTDKTFTIEYDYKDSALTRKRKYKR